MDFGASDIVKGIELAITIYQSGFVEENSASEKSPPSADLASLTRRL